MRTGGPPCADDCGVGAHDEHVPLGGDGKVAGDRLSRWDLDACPRCGTKRLRVPDERMCRVPLGDGTGRANDALKDRILASAGIRLLRLRHRTDWRAQLTARAEQVTTSWAAALR